jgi:hypothetical protein
MKNIQRIVLMFVLVMTFAVFAAAQNKMAIVTAKAKPVRQLTLPKGFSFGSFNQKVATKPSIYRHGNRAVVPGSKNKNLDFTIKPNSQIKDSKGNVLGIIAPPTGKVNYGATRKLKDSDGKARLHHQVWNTQILNGTPVSGWVQRSDFKVKPIMPTVTAKQPPKGQRTPYIITGGTPQSPRLGFINPSKQFVNPSKQFVPYKVTKGFKGGGRDSIHYGAARPGTGLVNQCLNLPGKGGVCHDAYPIGTGFHRITSIPSKTVPLYYPGGTKRVSSMKFIWGIVQTPTGRRGGWISLDVLKRKQ